MRSSILVIMLTVLFSSCAGRLSLPEFVGKQEAQREAECVQHLRQMISVLAGMSRLKRDKQFDLSFFQQAGVKRCWVIGGKERDQDEVVVQFRWTLADGQPSPWQVLLSYRCSRWGKCQVGMTYLVKPSEGGHGFWDKIFYKHDMEPRCSQQTAGFVGDIFGLVWMNDFSDRCIVTTERLRRYSGE